MPTTVVKQDMCHENKGDRSPESFVVGLARTSIRTSTSGPSENFATSRGTPKKTRMDGRWLMGRVNYPARERIHTLRKSNIAIENGPGLSRCISYQKWGIFQQSLCDRWSQRVGPTEREKEHALVGEHAVFLLHSLKQSHFRPWKSNGWFRWFISWIGMTYF